jgi:hypothetical protein
MKFYKLIGLSGCALLVISCFLPWAYYPDINKYFTGFFSEQNVYGKPGIIFVFVAVMSALCILIDKVWAKRTFLFFAALNIAYLIKTYILFTSCYNTICPEVKYGFFLVMLSSLAIILAAIFPKSKIRIPG